MVSEVGKAVAGEKLDAVLNVAGGWAGGNASSAEFIKVNEYGFITQYSKQKGFIIINFGEGRHVSDSGWVDSDFQVPLILSSLVAYSA